jgi:GNAT superfamily N-acetyltransferase
VVRGLLKELGVLGAAFYVADRALDRLSGGRAGLFGCWFYAQPVAREARVPIKANDIWQVGPVGPDRLPEEAFGRPSGAVPQRFRDGSVCVAALKGDELGGFMWLHFGPLRERLVRCVFEPLPAEEACWDYDFYIAPRYRMGRLFGRLWDAADEVMRARGRRSTVSWVTFSNRASARAHERLGARRAGWAAFLSLGVLQFTIASVRPFVHVSWNRGSACHLRIRIPANAAPRDGT